MISQSCSYETTRLLVKDWHSFTAGDWVERDLSDVVVNMLTERVTRQLPAGWQGTYTKERASQWISDRDREGSTLLAVARSSGEPVGVIILFESVCESTKAAELRLGYLLSEAFWGQGMASEVLRGFVDWCKANRIASIAGGVERGNVASQRILEKNGFVYDPDAEGVGPEELLFRLQLKP